MQIIHTLKDLLKEFGSLSTDDKIHTFLYTPDTYEVMYDTDNIDKDYCDENNLPYYQFCISGPAYVANPNDIALFWIIPNKKLTFKFEKLLYDYKEFLKSFGIECDVEKDLGHVFIDNYATSNQLIINIRPDYMTCFGAFHVMFNINHQYFNHIRKTSQDYEAKGLSEFTDKITREDIINFLTNWEKENINADEIVG